MGKGSKRRPRQISEEEDNLRWAYALDKINITEEEFNRRVLIIRKRTRKP